MGPNTICLLDEHVSPLNTEKFVLDLFVLCETLVLLPLPGLSCKRDVISQWKCSW